MTITQLLVQIFIAILCAGIANIVVPRKIPGRLAGLILVGLAGVWVGQWGFSLLRQEFGLNYPLLYWQVQRVLIIPSVVGCAIVLYLVTAFLKWGRYGH